MPKRRKIKGPHVNRYSRFSKAESAQEKLAKEEAKRMRREEEHKRRAEERRKEEAELEKIREIKRKSFSDLVNPPKKRRK